MDQLAHLKIAFAMLDMIQPLPDQMKEGVKIPKEKIDKMVDAYRRRFISRRAQNIARTESMAMVQSGQNQYWNQLVQSGLVEQNIFKPKVDCYS